MSINIALFGTGLMGSIYAKILAQRADTTIKAFVGNNTEKTTKIADAYKVPGYPNGQYDLMFKNHPDINAIIIATPEWVREAPLQSAVAHNKHIFLEKPFADSWSEAKRLYVLLDGYPQHFQICHPLRFSPHFGALRKAVVEGTIGEVRHIYARRNSNTERAARVQGKSDLAFWLSPHDIDMMRWVVQSEVESVYAISRDGARSLDDYLIVHLRFENGVDAVLENSWCGPQVSGASRHAVFEVWGTCGSIEIDDFNLDTRVFLNKDLVQVYDTFEEYEVQGQSRGIFFEAIDDFIRNIKQRNFDRHFLMDAIESMRTCGMIRKSVDEGKRVSRMEIS